MHRPSVSKGLAFLAAIFAFLAVICPLHAAEPQIKPFILTGDSAPDGGVFTFISSFSMNNLGAIAFVGSTATAQGIYLASESAGSQVMAQKVIKPGDPVIIPELLLSGVLVRKEPSKFFPGVIDYEFSDGHRLSCSPNGNLGFNLGGSLLNGNGDIAFRSGTSPLLFSGGTITSLSGCPGVTHLLMDLNPDDPSAGFPNDTLVSAINNADQFVSAGEIYEVNNTGIPDPTVIPDQNWSQSPLALQVSRNPGLLSFTAQTPLAASYGLLQILYPTAIAPMQWPGVGGARNPSFLFDTQANLSADGGSLMLGSGYLRRVFSRANLNVSLSDPNFPSREAFRDAFQRAFNLYRGTTSESGLRTGPYGLDVLHFSDFFLPVSAGPIFQQ